MISEKTNIKQKDFEYYKEVVESLGEKPFRAKQLREWLWQKHADSFDEMTNLPLALRDHLNSNYYISSPEIISESQSKDNTVKIALRLEDKEVIEGVLIPSRDRITACISSQAGCALGCKFCATATMGFKRNLTFFEIYDQFVILNALSNKYFKKNISNIVLMGMGEPLLNYDEVKKAIDLMISKDGLNMSPSRITLSTAGIAKGIIQMAEDNARYNLAISLHTADNKKRDLIMPLNKTNNLDELKEAIKYFHKKTSTRITYEYLLLGGFNDSKKDSEALASFCKISPCKINIIEYNPVEGSPFKGSAPSVLDEFAKYLESKNLVVNIRKSKGTDIDASCGQLAYIINKKGK